MFYFDSLEPVYKEIRTDKVQGLESFFLPHQIYSGKYWDEFSLPSLLLDFPHRVLMLGLGQGAGLRPILATGQVKEIVAIDNDISAIQETQRIYKKFFPKLQFSCIHQNAKEFLESNTSNTFDIIWVDLYSSDGYGSDISNPSFYKLLKKMITPQGIIALNSFGLPPHLNPLGNDTFANLILFQLHTNFSHVRYLPYRRNFTFFASNNIFPLPPFVLPQEHLKQGDKLVSQIQKLRLCSIIKSVPQQPNTETNSSAFIELQKKMSLRWFPFLEEFNNQCKACFKNNQSLEKPQDLFKFFDDKVRAEQLLTYLVAHNRKENIFFPVFIAAEKERFEDNATWFIDFVLKNWGFLFESIPQDFIHFYLPQTAAMMISEKNIRIDQLQALEEIVGSKPLTHWKAKNG
ncbi:MAG: hypothetical protein HYS98_08955 [Deltaproteobacteria bacterium]|nr:hypothetical protein [Deltaproteobacteria bacterium]